MKKQSVSLTRRSILAMAGVGLLASQAPRSVYASAKSSTFKVGTTAYGSSTDGYYEFSGHIELLVDTVTGSNSWTIFDCNRECAVGSIGIEAWIQYATDVVAMVRSTNSGRTNHQEISTVCNSTDNMGGGVIAYATASLAQVSGGRLTFNEVGIDPYARESISVVQGLNNRSSISVVGVNGYQGFVSARDLELPLFSSNEERLDYFSARTTEYVDVYSPDGRRVDLFPIEYQLN